MALCTKSRPEHTQQTCGPKTLFDYFVGSGAQGGWDREAQRLRGLKVDNHLELRWLNYGQIGWLGALEDPTDVNAGLTISVGEVGCVAHETSRHNKLTPEVNRRNFVLRGERNKLLTAAIEQGIDGYEQNLGLQLPECGKGRVKILFVVHVDDPDQLPELVRGFFQIFRLGLGVRKTGVYENADYSGVGDQLAEQFKSLCPEIAEVVAHAGYVAAWPA